METRLQTIIRTVLLLHVCWLWSGRCLSVHFTNQQPVYAIIGQDLILQAQIELLDGERVTKVTWDRIAKTSVTSSRVAEFPPKASSDGRVSVEQQGAALKIRNYKTEDGGVYTVTVMDQSGQRRSAQRPVLDYLAVNHVSVMVNVSHSVLHCMEAWGTEPSFAWLHEQVVVTEKVGQVSADGTSLRVSGSFCGHFTCVVSNRLGHSSATYTAEPCESTSRSTSTAVVLLLLLAALIAAPLALLLWSVNMKRKSKLFNPNLHHHKDDSSRTFLAIRINKRRRHGLNRRERLREPYEEDL